MFKFGYAEIEIEDDLKGIINTKGEVVIEPKYRKISPLSSNKFIAVEQPRSSSEEAATLSILNSNGKSTMSLKIGDGQKYVDFDLEASTSEYLAVCSSVDGERQWGYIDLSKNVIIKPTSKIRGLRSVKGKNFIFSDGENCGVMNFNGEVVLRAKYDNLSWADDDILIAYDYKDSRYSLINLKGEKITKESYLYILPFYDGSHAAIKVNDHSWGFINKKGDELSLKNVPDIYYVGNVTGGEYVESDFVDIDAIVSKLNLVKNGIMGYTLNMEPLQLVKAFNELSNEKKGLTPEDNTWTSRLYTEESSRGLDIITRVYVNSPGLTEYVDGNVVWTKEKPVAIEVVVGGNMIKDKTDLLFDKLKAVIKSYGKPMKENSRAVVVQMSESQGWIIVNENNRIEIGLVNTVDYQTANIDSYAKSGETTRVYIEPKLPQEERRPADADYIDEIEDDISE